MITLTKGMIGLSVLIAGGFVAIDALTPTPASIVSDRFVFTVDIPAPVGPGVDLTAARRDAAAALAAVTVVLDAAKKGDRLDVQAKAACSDQTWPNIASECLATTDGAPVRPAVRYVTVERRIGPSTSELVRTEVTDVASR